MIPPPVKAPPPPALKVDGLHRFPALRQQDILPPSLRMDCESSPSIVL